jgi:hypothetical protein
MKTAVLLKVAILFSLLASCSSMNQSLTPGTKTVVSDFDNSVEVIQNPISAASSLGEGWNTLGFRWNSKRPEAVYLMVGTKGIVNITGLSLNIDGEIIDVETASTLTDYDEWSTRQFVIPLEQFRKLAAADLVKMKVIMIDKYTVSSFGQTKPKAVVSGKFEGFLTQVDIQLNKD